MKMKESNLIDLPLWASTEVFKVLKELGEKHKVPLEVVEHLVNTQRERECQGRAAGVYIDITEALDLMD